MLSYVYEILTLLSIFVIASVSLSVVVGQAGLLSLVHGALLGVGAYVAAIVGASFDVNMVLAVAAGMIGTAVLAAALGSVIVQFDKERFAVTSLAIHLLIINVLTNWRDVTRGPYGIASIEKPALLGVVGTEVEFSILVIILAVITVAGGRRLESSGFCRLLRASAVDRDVVESLGSSVTKLRIWAFIIGGCGAGLAGGLYAIHYGYIAPQLFDLHLSILLLAMVVVGGARGAIGAAVGATILIVIPEALRFGPLPRELAGPMRQVIFGLLLVGAVYARGRSPGGGD